MRLKIGDPLVFGRAAEEMDALRAAGVDCVVVPGITAAFAAAAAIQCSLTDRRSASSVLFSTGHHAEPKSQPANDATRIVYMPGRDFSSLAAEWRREGLPDSCPASLSAAPRSQISRRSAPRSAISPTMCPAPLPVLVLAGAALANAQVPDALELLIPSALSRKSCGSSLHPATESWPVLKETHMSDNTKQSRRCSAPHHARLVGGLLSL